MTMIRMMALALLLAGFGACASRAPEPVAEIRPGPLQGSARFQRAGVDNHLGFPEAAGTFSCAVGTSIGESQTPFLYQLLRRSLVDAGLATYAAKNRYQRKRPFLRPQCSCLVRSWRA